VRDYLHSQSGVHFDPRAVAALLGVLAEEESQEKGNPEWRKAA
jgi:hypothetical protein